LTALRVVLAVCVLGIAGALAFGPPASAASCPTATYLNYDHLAYAEVGIAVGVQLPPGAGVGGGTIDQPTSSDGCKRARHSVQVVSAGSLDPHVAVLVSGLRQSVFVIGQRCAGFTGPSYWDCLVHPLVFNGIQYTATSYPSQPPPARTLTLGAALGTADYQGRRVTARAIAGVDPSLAVGISGRPSVALLSPRTCPYGGFSSTPQYDNLLRCLRAPVWFTFDPPGSQAGGTVVARSDRPVGAALVGASISLVQLSVAADYVPPHPQLVPVGRVADQVSLTVPNVRAGVYEAVVSCPRCSTGANGGSLLYPAGSILVASKPKTSLGIRIVNYALLAAVAAVLILGYRVRRRRRAAGVRTGRPDLGRMLGSMLLGPGPAGSSRRGRSWTEDAAARPPARGDPAPAASPPAKRKARAGRDGRRGRNGGSPGRKRDGG
jgi:hypothetical protein